LKGRPGYGGKRLELFPDHDERITRLAESLLRSGDRLRYLADLVDATEQKDRNKLRKLRKQPLPLLRALSRREADFLGIHLDEPGSKAKRRRGRKPAA
jgi:hypothetical protein